MLTKVSGHLVKAWQCLVLVSTVSKPIKQTMWP